MQRYIDADALLERMKRTPRYFDVKYDIEEMPTADVVPREEVEALLKENDRWMTEYEGFRAGVNAVVENAKQELAREIFEEIEKEVDRGLSVISKILNAKGGRANGKTILISKYDVFIEAKKHLAELKKRYTEDNDVHG